MLPMDNVTPDNMNSLVEIGEKLLELKVAMVDLTTGRYETVEDEDAMTNDEELERFAQSLVNERNLHLDNEQEEEDDTTTDETQDEDASSSSVKSSHVPPSCEAVVYRPRVCMACK